MRFSRSSRRYSLIAGLLFSLAILASCSPPGDFDDISGSSHRYADFKDRWVVINYWATWCGPCIKEIPELNQLAADHADELVVLGVNWDEPVSDLAVAQAAKMKITFPVYAQDPSAKLGIAKPDVLPTTFLFAPGMKRKEALVGRQTAESILAAIDASTPKREP